MTMPNAEHRAVVGSPLNRVDGRKKVTGTARYTAEVPVENIAYGIMVQSTIARGEIAEIDTRAAEQLAGVITVLTQDNMPKLESMQQFDQHGGPRPTGRALSLFQDDKVDYNGQPIALVVAESFEVAMQAASLIRPTYHQQTPTIDVM